MYKKLFFAGVIFSFLVLPMAALADSISPTTVTSTISVGSSLTIHKTVTVSAGTPTAAQGDVLFLTDTTGSMGGLISTVQTNATAILTGLGVYANVQTGAASYRDFYVAGQIWGSPGDYAYQTDSVIDGAAGTQTGINTWVASGGNDYPEAELYALQQVAGTAPGWRTGSEKIVLWFGDSPGHDPNPASGSAYTPGYPGPTLATTIAALTASGVTVDAFDLNTLDAYGQATAITGATGGTLTDGFPTDTADVVAAIVAAIGEAFSTYTAVGIEAPSLAGLGISIVPTDYMGSFDRSVERTFGFDVTFMGLAPGTYTFDLFGTVDGGRVATERDIITVRVPEPGTLLLLGMGLAGLAGFRKRLFAK